MPSSGDLPDPGIQPSCLLSPALAARFFTLVPPGKFILEYLQMPNEVDGAVLILQTL